MTSVLIAILLLAAFAAQACALRAFQRANSLPVFEIYGHQPRNESTP